MSEKQYKDDDKTYFIWIKSWCGGNPEPQIVKESFLPKKDLILRKHLLEAPYDEFALETLVVCFPLELGNGGVAADVETI